ncbi:MAG: hypothetical protein ACTS80_01920 [Candidatus Hodgkinia cicadicola]
MLVSQLRLLISNLIQSKQSQVIKSSRVMKTAVKALTPLLERKLTTNAPVIVLATVKGDSLPLLRDNNKIL